MVRGPGSRLMLTGLACVSLLQLPLPILHCHAEFMAPAALQHHLQRHHRDGHSARARHWHWHFMLPNEFDPHEGEKPDKPPSSAVALDEDGDSKRGSLASAAEAMLLSAQPVPSAVACGSDARRASLNRIDRTACNLAPAVRLCALLAVIRC